MYLNCHTFFSLRYGTLSVEELVQHAADLGIGALALTDINNTSGALDFIGACEKAGIKPIVGIEFRRADELLYIGLARNSTGFESLNQFLTDHNLAATPLPDSAPELAETEIIYPIGKREVKELKANEWLGIRKEQTGTLQPADIKAMEHKLVVWQPVTFVNRKGYDTHRLLRAINHNTLLSLLPPAQLAPTTDTMPAPAELLRCFGNYTAIIKNTLDLTGRCGISFDPAVNKNRHTFTGDAAGDRELLQKLALDGMLSRYGRHNRLAAERVKKELKIISEMNFCAYFLITWDIIRYAQMRDFRHVGRGSGANSIVAYCLRITDVDPIELDLYFERFLNRHRTCSPPDFDIDFSWKERDEVTDYIFKRYGHKHTALLATYTTFQGRSVLRELGKVFGLPKTELDALAYKNPSHQYNPNDRILGLIHTYGEVLQNVPNHLSIHAGGILITDKPITCYTALDLPPKGLPITHFDMYTAEDAGLYKYDILSQRGLGHIKDALTIIKQNTGQQPDIEDVAKLKKDPGLHGHIREGNTIGCFYIESPAMRQLLRKLRCQDYLTLVAASSIIRPGVSQSGMMKEYIHRFHNPGKFTYLHPKMEELLKETYGVMVYQEDVIKVAHHFAGLDLADADMLRRAMSGKQRSRMGFEKMAQKFRESCLAQGHSEKVTEEVWRQIESFSGYSFSKAHSASFAVESYQSLYLKVNYPLEFMVAVINNFGGFYSTELYLHEARMNGATIEAPCVNHSGYLTGISGTTIWLGFIHLTRFEHKTGQLIAHEREANGDFTGLEDFMRRIPQPIEQLNLLIRIGALRFTGKTREALLWEAVTLLAKGHLPGSKHTKLPARLFTAEAKAFTLPPLDHHPLDDAYNQIELLGFPLCSPFELAELPAELEEKLVAATCLAAHKGKNICMAGYLVAVKDIRTAKGDHMQFATLIDHQGQLFDTIHWPASLKRYYFTGNGFYLLHGKVTEEFGYFTLEVHQMEKLPRKQRQAEVSTRVKVVA